jgi:branched-chain amino acid aminotransferase
MTAGANHDILFALNPTTDPVPAARRAELMADPGFGRVFTDNMVTIAWTA